MKTSATLDEETASDSSYCVGLVDSRASGEVSYTWIILQEAKLMKNETWLGNVSCPQSSREPFHMNLHAASVPQTLTGVLQTQLQQCKR